MAEQQKSSGASGALEKSAHAAQTIRSAVKTGKAIAGAAKGAVVGGPYGVVAAGLWQNRKTVVKIILAAAFIMLLPILFIMMLPSLIFGGLGGSPSAESPIMNNNTAIMSNITAADAVIQMVMQSSYDAVITTIQADIDGLAEGIQHQIINPYADNLFYNRSLIISQYCVSRANYETINLSDFQRVVEQGKEHLFSYRKDMRTEIVQNDNGSQTTITTAVYTVQFSGEEYFATTLFALNEEQQEYARNYAENLNLFLGDSS